MDSSQDQAPTRLIPLLTLRSFSLLGALTLGPILSLLLDIDVSFALLISSILAALFLLQLCLEYLSTRHLAKSMKISLETSAKLRSGLPSNINITLDTDVSTPARLTLKPQIPIGIEVPNETAVFSVPVVKSNSTLPYTFTPLHRGALEWSYAWARVKSKSGIFQWQFKKPLIENLKVTVYPNSFCDTLSKPFAMSRLDSGITLFEQSGGEGKEFDSLRSYAPGDDPRRVDWKRTAKRASLVVKTYRPETHQRINVIVDCSRRMGSVIEKRLQLDYAADAASYLARVAISGGDEVGLFAFNHRTLASVGCRRGLRQQSHIMELLAELKVGELEGDYQLMKAWGRKVSRRSLFVLLTSVSSAMNIDTLRKNLLPLTAKHLPLVVAMYDRDLEHLVNKQATCPQDAYIQAAAWEQMQSIQKRIRVLRKSGIECLYSDALNISELLRRKYYELKLSGRF